MTVRERLPNRRASIVFDFQHARLSYTCSYSCFADGRVAEVFLQNHKGGSDADVTIRDSAISTSLTLQYGCPLDVLRHAMLQNPDGAAAGALGRAIDGLRQAVEQYLRDEFADLERQIAADRDGPDA
jgi:hypothetical protein